MIAQLGISTVCSHGSVSRFRNSALPSLMIGDRPMATAVNKMFAI